MQSPVNGGTNLSWLATGLLLAVAVYITNAGTLVKFGPRDNILAELGGGNVVTRND